MGMLGRVANAIGEVGEKIFDYNLKKMAVEDELKMREEIERNKEARIEEQWQKRHDIERGEQMTDQQWKLNEETKQKAEERQAKREDYVFQKGFDQSLENDPNSIDYQKAMAAIKQSEASTSASLAQAGKYNAETAQESLKLDLQQRALKGDEDAQQGLLILEKNGGRMDITRNIGTDEHPALQKGYVDAKGIEHFADNPMISKAGKIKSYGDAKEAAGAMIDAEISAKFPDGRPKNDAYMGFSASPEIEAKQKEYDALTGKKDALVNQKALELMGVDKQSSSGGGMLGAATANKVDKDSKGENFNVFNLTSTKGGMKQHDSVEEAVSDFSDYVDRRQKQGWNNLEKGIINKRLAAAGHPQDEKLGDSANTVERFYYGYAPPEDKNDTEAYVKNAVNMINAQLPEGRKITRSTRLDLSDPLIKRGLMLASGAQEGEDLWKIKNKEFIEAINKETTPAEKTASSNQVWDIDENGKPFRVR